MVHKMVLSDVGEASELDEDEDEDETTKAQSPNSVIADLKVRWKP